MTEAQFQALTKLRDAIREAHSAFSGPRDIAFLHGMADRLVRANRSNMTDEQFQALGGGTPKEA